MKLFCFTLFVYLQAIFHTVGCLAQTAGTSACMEIRNVHLIGPNEFVYDVVVTNTGSTVFELRNYTWGINATPGFANGGTITHSFLAKDISLSLFPSVTATYSSSIEHLRGTSPVPAATVSFNLIFGQPLLLATMSVKNTVPFDPGLGVTYDPFNPTAPKTPLQVLTQSGYGQAVISGRINGSNFNLYGTGNVLTSNNLNVLSGSYGSWGVSCVTFPANLEDVNGSAFSIFPNPAKDIFQIKSSQSLQNINLKITDAFGSVVKESKNQKSEAFTVDIVGFPLGIYFVELEADKVKQQFKILKSE